MEITVNNKSLCVDETTAVSTVVGSDTKGVAVAVNGKIVKKNDWDTTPLKEGDDVVVIRAAYGG